MLLSSGLKGRVNLKTVSALWLLHLQCLNSLKIHGNITWGRCWGQYAKFLWFIPQPLVVESGHSRDKLVPAVVFIFSSFHLRQWSKAVTLFQLCFPCVFSFEGGHNWAIWLWIISAVQRERERYHWLSWQQKMMRCLLETEFCTRIHIKPHLKIGVWRTLLETVHSSFQTSAAFVQFYPRIYGRHLSESSAQDRTNAFISKRHALVQEWGSFPDCKSGVWSSQPVNCLLFI